MSERKKMNHWATQVRSKDCEEMDCPEYDLYKDIKLDPGGHYALVRIEWDVLRIAVAVCDKQNQIIKIFRGRKAQDVYAAIFRHEQKQGVEWFQSKEHVAYLGKELKKAEIAMAIGIKDYFQE